MKIETAFEIVLDLATSAMLTEGECDSNRSLKRERRKQDEAIEIVANYLYSEANDY